MSDAVKGIENMRESMDDFGHSVHSASTGWFSLLKGLTAHDAVRGIATIIKEQTTIGKNFSLMLSGLRSGVEPVKKEMDTLWTKALQLQPGPDFDKQLLSLGQQYKQMTQIMGIVEAFTGMNKVWLGTALAVATLFTSTLASAREFNQNLIEANSSLAHRGALARDTLVTSMRTGIAFGEMTKAAAALVHYGMDTKTTWQTNVRLVGQLNAGLGLSVEQGARLAALVENRIQGGFEDVAKTVAQLVEYTSLTANEAARLGEELTGIAATLGERSTGSFSKVLGVLGEYGSAFKQLGGSADEVAKLVEHLATLEGMPGAAMLGFNNMEFATSATATEQMFRTLSSTVARMTRDMNSYQRQAMLQPLAAQYNMSWKTLNLMGKIEEQRQKIANSELTINERFSNQMRAAGGGLSRIWNELATLFQRVAYPIIEWFNGAATTVADWLGDLNKSISETSGVIESLTAALVVASGAIMLRLIPALWKLAVLATSSLLPAGGLAGIQTALTGMSFGGGVAAVASSAAPLLVIAASLGAIYAALNQWFKYRKLKAEEAELRASVAKMQDTQAAHRAVALRGAYSGDWTDIERGLFGIGGSDRGYIEQLAAKRGISHAKAAEIAVAELRPVLDARLAQVAQAAAEGGEKSAAAIERYEALVKAMTSIQKEVAEIEARQHQKFIDSQNAIQKDQFNRGQLSENVKPKPPVVAPVIVWPGRHAMPLGY